MEFFPGFSSLQIIQEVQNYLRRRNIELDEFTDWIICVNVLDKKEMMEFVFRIRKKSRNTRRDSRKDTARFLVLETRRSGMELFLTHLKENGILQPLRMVERFEDTGHPVFKGVSVLIREILKKKNGRETPYTSMRMTRTQNSCSESFSGLLLCCRGIVRKGLCHFDNCILTSSPHLSQLFPMFGSFTLIPLCTSLCGHLSC